MFTLVIGGSGSGKSEYAENQAVQLHTHADLIYIATMKAFDEESKKRIERHRQQREGKDFQTMECFLGLKEVQIPDGSTVLLDCMSNLVANEFFDEQGAGEDTIEQVISGVGHLLRHCENVVIVSNDVFADGYLYDAETTEYIQTLGVVNQRLAQMADTVVECVCGILLVHKSV